MAKTSHWVSEDNDYRVVYCDEGDYWVGDIIRIHDEVVVAVGLRASRRVGEQVLLRRAQECIAEDKRDPRKRSLVRK